MNLGKLLPRGSDVWKPGDAEPVTIGCDQRLGVSVTVWDPVAKRLSDPENPDDPPDIDAPEYQNGAWAGDWLFRPPGACGRKQCGTLLVSVEAIDGGAVATAEAALDTVVVELAPLGAEYEGRLRIRAELRENGGDTVGVYEREPLADELEIDVVAAECPNGQGGAGGAPSTGGTSGAATGGDGNGGVPAMAGAGGASGALGESGAGGA